MTDVTQMRMGVGLLCSLHEAFWMIWWMEQNYKPIDLQNMRHGRGTLTGTGRRLLLTLGYGLLWYGMREQLSCIPALLFFTISFHLLWECEEKESFLYAAGYLFGLEVTLWFAGRLPQNGILIGQMVWLAGNLITGRLCRTRRVQKYRRQQLSVLGTMGAAFFLTLFFGDFLWDMLRGEDTEALAYIAEVQEPVRAVTVPVLTGVELVDTVLYEAGEQAKAKQIGLEMQTAIFTGIDRIQKKDICALFANLTDNALEAAESRIRLTTRTVPGMLLLEIENDYREKPELSEGHFQTGKADRAKHGWGLRIVEQIVRKYEGQISYETLEETGDFRVRVWMNL